MRRTPRRRKPPPPKRNDAPSVISAGRKTRTYPWTVIASEAKQSIPPHQERMDCFVAYAPRNDERNAHLMSVTTLSSRGIAYRQPGRLARLFDYQPFLIVICLTPATGLLAVFLTY